MKVSLMGFVVILLLAQAARADETIPVRSFNSSKCLANIGKAGVADCNDGNKLVLMPLGPNKVMLRSNGNQCLYSNKDGRFAWYACTPKFDDQHWDVIAPDANADAAVRQGGWRMLRSVHSGQCLFSNKDGRFGLYTCTQKFNDQFWLAASAEPAPAPIAQTPAAPPADAPMSDADFATLVAAIQAESFSADQLGALELGAKGRKFSVAQVGSLVDLYSYSADKLAALKMVRAQIVDHANEVKLLEHFTFSADKASARQILAK